MSNADPGARPPAAPREGGGPAAAPPAVPRPKLAVWKFASCDGCQLTLLDCQDELLALAAAVEIAHFTEASSADVAGPYDVSLVEGSVTTQEDVRRIGEIRAASRALVTIGACATSGGIQALRNFADVTEFTSVVYARPEYISTLATSTAIAGHVAVDFELRGCPIDRRQLLELLTALLAGRRPAIPAHSVCYECKQRGNVCVMVAHGTPCLGPVTQAGCGAICPAFSRGCYGCFGPTANPDTVSLTAQLRHLGMPSADLERVYSTFNTAAPAFAAAGQAVAAAEPERPQSPPRDAS
jgi:sulfhydrogenase subunit delta